MSDQIAKAVPADTVAYAKGGEVISFNGFNTKSFAGQMIVDGDRATPVTFCFLVNWDGPAEAFHATEAAFFAAIKGVLAVIKPSVR